MSASMPATERERYARAFYYAVVEKDLQFASADAFADWWAREGWRSYSHIEVGYYFWAANW